MALNGHLATMPITDVLQWIATARRTGTLNVERNKVSKLIHFRQGQVVGCSSSDPPALLGQFLLSRGKIDEEQLRQALERQEVTKENMGQILVGMGVLTEEDLRRALTAKAEETIHGLFDWDDAVFRFEENAAPDDPYLIEVEMDVQEVLLRGMQRYDEMNRFRGVFSDEGIVLQRTDKAAPAEVQNSRMARRIYESINGERTLAEIVLHAHASEYLVTKFLFQLHRLGHVEIKEVRAVRREEQAVPEATRQDEVVLVAAGGSQPVAASGPETGEVEASSNPDLAAEMEVAMRLLAREEHEAALQVLNASYRAYPGDATLAQLVAKTERAFEQAQQHEFAPQKLPTLKVAPEALLRENLSPEASFLPSLIDGKTDIKSLLWLSPIRSVDVMRALKQMLDKGLIELCDPA